MLLRMGKCSFYYFLDGSGTFSAGGEIKSALVGIICWVEGEFRKMTLAEVQRMFCEAE